MDYTNMQVFSTAMPYQTYAAPIKQPAPKFGTSAEKVQFAGITKPKKFTVTIATLSALATGTWTYAGYSLLHHPEHKEQAFVYTLPKNGQVNNSLQDVLKRFPVTTERTISPDVANSRGWTIYSPWEGYGSSSSEFHPPLDYTHQKGIGDCYFDATYNRLIENPRLGPNWVENLINPVADPDDSYGIKFIVTFPAYPDIPITVHLDEIDVNNASQGAQQVRIIELAYAKLSQKVHLHGSLGRKGLSKELDSINAGGYPGISMEVLTGVKADRVSSAQAGDLLKRAEQDPDRYLMVIYAYNEKQFKHIPSNLKSAQVVGGHAYTLSYDKKVGKWFIKNPWDPDGLLGTADRSPITKEQMRRFGWIDVVDLGNANPFPKGQSTPNNPNIYRRADFVYKLQPSPTYQFRQGRLIRIT